MIYFDNGATTFPKPRAVVRAVNQTLTQYGANPGRSGHKMSIKAAEIIYSCRRNAAKLFGIDNPENIIFTLNCTMALNTVIKGVLKDGGHAVISSLEHNAVVRPLEKLKSRGVSYSVAEYVPYDDERTIDNFRNAFNENTKLVICTHASNVFGFRLPVERIAALCRLNGILFCLDAAQTAGVIPINLSNTCIDFLCTAGHKGLYGPMGTGLLVINSDYYPDSLIEGGTGSMSYELNQPDILPDKYESGTQNLAGIAGLDEGIKFVLARTPEKILAHEMRLAQIMYDRLSAIDEVILYTSRPDSEFSVPVISFNLRKADSEEVAMKLSQNEIAVRAGLHCAPLAHKSMNTIQTGTVRAVLSVFNSYEEIKFFSTVISRIKKLKNQVKKVEIIH